MKISLLLKRICAFGIFVLRSSLYLLLSKSLGVAAITARRHLSESIHWRSCNAFDICYDLSTTTADIGHFAHRYYTGPIEIKIYHRNTRGPLQWLRTLTAEEGQWNYDENLWVLKIPNRKGQLEELRFAPETINK